MGLTQCSGGHSAEGQQAGGLHVGCKVVTMPISRARLQVPIQMSQLLLRGCKLKNSRHVLGMVVYTGDDTRIQQNSAAAPRKIGAFDYFLDVQVTLLILFQLALCTMCAVLSYWWRETHVRFFSLKGSLAVQSFLNSSKLWHCA